MPHNYSRVSEGASALHVMADGNVTACGRAGTRWVMDAASAYDGLLYAYYSHVCERCAARTVGAVPTYADKLQAEVDRAASKALDAAIDAESDEVPAGQVHMTYARDRVSGAHNGDRCTTCGRSAHRRNGSWQGHPFTSADDDAHAVPADNPHWGTWIDELTNPRDAYQAMCPCGWTGTPRYVDDYTDTGGHPADMAHAVATSDADAHEDGPN